MKKKPFGTLNVIQGTEAAGERGGCERVENAFGIEIGTSGCGTLKKKKMKKLGKRILMTYSIDYIHFNIRTVEVFEEMHMKIVFVSGNHNGSSKR